ncbi:MAG: RagB/SusD family nutrient uptake outer membrane protein [Saprospiraceae bacterium]
MIKYIIPFFLILSVASCDIEDLSNPNGSSIAGFDKDATKSSLQTLVTGIEDLLRQDVGFYYDVVSIVGREYYFFTGSDPRYTGEVLGKGQSQLDNAGFYGTRPFSGRYRTVKTANVLIDGATNSSLITPADLNGYLGYAKTMQAYELHLVANLQFENGIRLDVSDPQNLSDFVSYQESLAGIQSLLDEGASNLGAAGGSFPFSLSGAMTDFSDPSSFLGFNRGISARIALYQGNKSDALSKLSSSFMDMGGDLNVGPARFYSSAGGDFNNNLFRTPDQADAIIVHPSLIADATAGDARLSKVLLRQSGTLTLDGLSGDYDVFVYKSLTDFVPFIRNEELILINAEANIGGNNGAAIAAINVIRNAAGIGDYSGGMDDASLINEVLYQRRYSLLGEAHRWVDMRRLGKLGDLPIDREGDDVWVQFPRPVTEN